jgi:hypothetical protein
MTRLIPTTVAAITLASGLALGAGPAFAQSAAPEVKLDNVVGRLVWRNAPGPVRVTIGEGAFKPRLSQSGGVSAIQGPDNIRLSQCSTRNNVTRLRINDRDIRLEELPEITVTAPAEARLVIDGGVLFGGGATLGAGDIGLSSCGDLRFDAVRARLDARV